MRVFLLVILAVLALCQAEETVQPKLGFPHLNRVDLSKLGLSEEILKNIAEYIRVHPHPDLQMTPLGHVNPEIPENLKHKIVDDTIKF